MVKMYMKLNDVVTRVLDYVSSKCKTISGQDMPLVEGDMYSIFIEDFETDTDAYSRIYKILKDNNVIDESGFLSSELTQMYQLIDLGHFTTQLNFATVLPEKINMYGLARPDLIIEPVSVDKFAVSHLNAGSTKVELRDILAEEFTLPGKKRPQTKYLFSIGGHDIDLEEEPSVNEIYTVSNYNLDLLPKLLENPPSTQQVWVEVKSFLKKYIEMDEHNYDISTLFIFQSWLAPVMNAVFYLAIKAPFGGGKTTLGTSIASLCRHGYTVGNISAASLARGVEKRQGTVFADEIDQGSKASDEDAIWNVLRIGQKRSGGADVYERSTSEGKIQRFRVFGPKLFAVHSQVEEALAQRSISIVLYPANDQHFAIKNQFRFNHSKNLKTKLLAWYLHNGMYFLDKMKSAVITEVDDQFYFTSEVAKNAFDKTTISLKKIGLTPRNIEIAMIMFQVAEVMGEDIESSITRSIIFKMQEDEEFKNIGMLDILRENLIYWFDSIRESFPIEFSDPNGYICVPYEVIYKGFNGKLRRTGIQAVTTKQFRGLLRELAIDKDNMFRKVRLPSLSRVRGDDDKYENATSQRKSLRKCFVFGEDLCKILGIEVNKSEKKTLEDFGA